jgi:hypothetical protein
MIMNLVWALRIKHYGSAKVPGSLANFFHIMEKRRLAGGKPNFYALTTALSQILNGIILAAWEKECRPLDDYSSTKPSPEQLKVKACIILKKYLTPLQPCHDEQSIHPTPSSKKNPTSTSSESNTHPSLSEDDPSESPTPISSELNTLASLSQVDPSNSNLRLLARDLLIVAEVTDAVSKGDFGRIEDLLPHLGVRGHCAGKPDYYF